jgi:small-conductance mechanosensitive channel
MLIHFGLMILATLVIASLLSRWVVRVLTKRGSGEDDAVRSYARFVWLVVFVIGLAIALHTIGINMTHAFAAGGIFALVIGFAVKNIAENFVAGVILRLEHTISPGDVIEIDRNMVRVTHVGTRATTARTLDDEDILIPNSKLIGSNVINFTLRDPFYRLSTEIKVPAEGLDLVRTALEDAARAIPWRASDREPEVFLDHRDSSTATYKVAVWIDDPWAASKRRSDFNEALWKSLEAHQ